MPFAASASSSLESDEPALEELLIVVPASSGDVPECLINAVRTINAMQDHGSTDMLHVIS